MKRPICFAAVAAAVAAWTSNSDARVTKVVVDKIESPLCLTRNSDRVCTSSDPNYETITGRAFGALDPLDEHNALITDISAAPRVDGKAQYIASFFVVKPIDMSK